MFSYVIIIENHTLFNGHYNAPKCDFDSLCIIEANIQITTLYFGMIESLVVGLTN